MIKEYLLNKRIPEEQNSPSRRVFFWLFLLALNYKRTLFLNVTVKVRVSV